MDSDDLNKESKMGLLPLFTVANMESDFGRAGPFKKPLGARICPAVVFLQATMSVVTPFCEAEAPITFREAVGEALAASLAMRRGRAHHLENCQDTATCSDCTTAQSPAHSPEMESALDDGLHT